MGTRLQYHKIHGVELNTCTAEQKIAYNFAFRHEINYGDRFRKMDVEINKQNAIHDIITQTMNEIRGNEKISTKYNIDSIFCALNAGLKNYMEHPFIANNYKEIGDMFPANYL